jgi:SH3 domain protein
MRSQLTLILLTLAVTSAAAQAEQLYVADKLVLNVYAEPDQASARVATIETGDAVEALERRDNFVHVQLSDGQAGWVGANYLVSQAPAIVRLKELQSSQPGGSNEQPKQRAEDIARLKKQNTTLQAELAALKNKVAASPTTAISAVSAVGAGISAERVELASAQAPPQPTIIIERSYWWAWFMAVLLAMAGGFFVGYATLGRRVRERFGGVKVY